MNVKWSAWEVEEMWSTQPEHEINCTHSSTKTRCRHWPFNNYRICRLFSIYWLLATGFSYFISYTSVQMRQTLEWIPMREKYSFRFNLCTRLWAEREAWSDRTLETRSAYEVHSHCSIATNAWVEGEKNKCDSADLKCLLYAFMFVSQFAHAHTKLQTPFTPSKRFWSFVWELFIFICVEYLRLVSRCLAKLSIFHVNVDTLSA